MTQPYFALTTGDVITCNVDGREEKFYVQVYGKPTQVSLRNVNGDRKPLTIRMGDIIKTFKNE